MFKKRGPLLSLAQKHIKMLIECKTYVKSLYTKFLKTFIISRYNVIVLNMIRKF